MTVSTDPPTPSTPQTKELARRPPPRRGFKHHLAGLVLRLFGWRAIGDPPDVQQCVIVAAPHTALADGFWMMAFAWWWGLDIRWLVKVSMTRGPLGWLIRRVGAVPVERSTAHGLVTQLSEEFARQPRLYVSVSPEGTRVRREYWKSGFYHIARAAGVPICLSYLDYRQRAGGFGPCFMPTGDYKADMDIVRAFYAQYEGKVPKLFTPPLLKEETGAAEDPNPANSIDEDLGRADDAP